MNYGSLQSAVELHTSSNYQNVRSPWRIFEYFTTTRWASDDYDLYPWIQINLKNSYFFLNQYTICSVETDYSFQGWKLEVSHNNKTESKVVIDSLDSTDLLTQNNYSCAERPVISHNVYNTFRFIMTKKPQITNHMRVSSIEFHGTFYTKFRLCTNKQNHQLLRTYLFVSLFISTMNT